MKTHHEEKLKKVAYWLLFMVEKGFADSRLKCTCQQTEDTKRVAGVYLDDRVKGQSSGKSFNITGKAFVIMYI